MDSIRDRDDLGISPSDAELLTRSPTTADLFEAALGRGASPRAVANWIIHELPRTLGGTPHGPYPFGGEALGELVAMVEKEALSRFAAREVLTEMVRTGHSPAAVLERRRARYVTDLTTLRGLVDEVVLENPHLVEAFGMGSSALLGFFIGEVMRRAEGRADPEEARDLLLDRLRSP